MAQDDQEAPNTPPRLSPGGPEEAKFIGFPHVVEGCWRVLLLGLPKAQDGPRGSQNRAKMVPKASTMTY
eukprot:7347994-Pyramimonas_sp.AAC.1